jgi:DNA polymerase/3'-5' exonuclease PolX
MELVKALTIANEVRRQLAPHCLRIEIAGSVRRRKPEVKDIEIVCIPRRIRIGLFNADTEVCPGFIRIINQWEAVKGSATGKYTQRILPQGINLDLFMATPDNWGLIYAIRTGSAGYSHHILARGWTRAGYKSINGMLNKNGQPIPIREEIDLFNLIGLPWQNPADRKFE